MLFRSEDFRQAVMQYNKETLFCTFETESGVQFALWLPDVIMQDPVLAQRYGYESSQLIKKITTELIT